MGDDQNNEYLYRFVSDEPYRENDPTHNQTLLDHGTLYVAECKENGELHWHALRFGEEPLTPKNGFASEADMLIDTRFAADAVNATPMDRPEGIAIHPRTGAIYLSLTKNTERTSANPGNPRANNPYGHILELLPPRTEQIIDHTATIYRWNILLLAGDPRLKEDAARYDKNNTTESWLTNPDNLTFDPAGHLWIATDGMQEAKNVSDGLYAMDINGEGRAIAKHFLNAPIGAEVTGPSFTPDGTTLFLSIQHPGGNDGSTFEAPSTRWPDFNDTTPPRPSVIAITHKDGKKIGE